MPTYKEMRTGDKVIYDGKLCTVTNTGISMRRHPLPHYKHITLLSQNGDFYYLCSPSDFEFEGMRTNASFDKQRAIENRQKTHQT